MADKPLTPREERFCQEYTVDYNQTKAAIRAGYKESTAAKQGCKLMKDPRILARIREIQTELADRLMLNRELVLLKMMEVLDICMAAKPVMVWSSIQHTYVESGEYQIDSKGAAKILELIGKHLGMFDKKELPDGDTGPVFISGEEELKP